MKAGWKTRVENATVRLDGKGGQGVLVPGGFILTATHCIQWSGTGGMALGDVYAEQISTPSGERFRVALAACDPVSDMAALAELDNQQFPDEYDAFGAWQEQVAPVPLSNVHLEAERSCRIFILTHKREWLTGRVTRHGLPGPPNYGTLALHPDAPIEAGTSGGPVVTATGKLVGVISNTAFLSEHPEGRHDGSFPIAHLTLPRWVIDKIEWRPTRESRAYFSKWLQNHRHKRRTA